MKIYILSSSLVAICLSMLTSCEPFPQMLQGSSMMTSSAPAPAPVAEVAESPPSANTTGEPEFPIGKWPEDTTSSNLVVSPFPPNNLIDITGYKSGDIVGDVSTAAINKRTGKVDIKTSKYFRIP